MTKAEEKRAAIIAQQAARQLAEGPAQPATGTDSGGAKRRKRFVARSPFGGQSPGRPPKT
jgi:hypothetical protein